MKCPRCGYENSVGASFCAKCGMKLQKEKVGNSRDKNNTTKIIMIVSLMIAIMLIIFMIVKTQKETTFTAKKSTTKTVTTTEENAEDVIEKHTYEMVLSDCTWEEARMDAVNAGGYLVNINDAEEYAEILDQLRREGYNDKDYHMFIGGCREYVDSYEYYWIDKNYETYGEDVSSYDFWAANEWLPGEPSYRDEAEGVDEYYMLMFYKVKNDEWYWNDVADDMLTTEPYLSGKVGYIIEYD